MKENMRVMRYNRIPIKLCAETKMNWKYLGDSKDAFKWDYLDFLAGELRVDVLYYVSMWTLEEETKEGKTSPVEFPALNKKIQKFCNCLKKMRSAGELFRKMQCRLEMLMGMAFYKILRGLPKRAGRHRYRVRIHKPNVAFRNSERDGYFCGIAPAKQIVFLDPDTGFQPETKKNISEKHVRYSDIKNICGQAGGNAIVVVFQDMSRKSQSHYNKIKGRLAEHGVFYTTALIWPGKVMPVAMGKKIGKIKQVRKANAAYKCMVEHRPSSRKIQLRNAEPKT